ncbi:unnamed protein product [Rotaria socialis]|nr:unnamed protein product [Rotaria socialis]
MPKTLLPYALSLNPGLPMHIQQLLIKQESERKALQQQHQPRPMPINFAILPAEPSLSQESSEIDIDEDSWNGQESSR